MSNPHGRGPYIFYSIFHSSIFLDRIKKIVNTKFQIFEKLF